MRLGRQIFLCPLPQLLLRSGARFLRGLFPARSHYAAFGSRRFPVCIQSRDDVSFLIEVQAIRHPRPDLAAASDIIALRRVLVVSRRGERHIAADQHLSLLHELLLLHQRQPAVGADSLNVAGLYSDDIAVARAALLTEILRHDRILRLGDVEENLAAVVDEPQPGHLRKGFVYMRLGRLPVYLRAKSSLFHAALAQTLPEERFRDRLVAADFYRPDKKRLADDQRQYQKHARDRHRPAQKASRAKAGAPLFLDAEAVERPGQLFQLPVVFLRRPADHLQGRNDPYIPQQQALFHRLI